jgi:DNA processing protein
VQSSSHPPPDQRSSGIKLSDEQILDWLRLIRTEGVGPRTFFSLINHYGGAAQALSMLPELARKRGGPIPRICSQAEAEAEFVLTRRFGARFIARGEPDYPKALAVIDSAPPLLSSIGPVNLAAQPLVSLVGSRNASTAGLKMAERLSTGLGHAGYGVVSGLARGIDTRAHQASLPTCAVAVVAGGLDKLYPEENRGLFEALCAKGAVVSEMPMGWQPRGRDFPRRNRIVSGLSLGTVIIEAARKSGSLITARFANEQGRVVFAVPGSPFDLRAEGPNDLIREGARLVRHAQDVLDELDPMREREIQGTLLDSGGAEQQTPLWDETDWLDSGLTPVKAPAAVPYDGWEEGQPASSRDRILLLLSSAPSDPDELARTARISAREVQILLYELEQEGLIERSTGGRIVIATKEN